MTKNAISISYNNELKMLRIQSKIKAKDIALRLKKSPSWVTKMEKGEIYINEDLYNKIKGYYSSNIEMHIKEKKYEEKIKLLMEENQKLKELLLLYMPYDEKDINRIIQIKESEK